MKSHGATLEAPGDVRERLGLARALSDGDLGAALACFAREACLITPDATAIHGRDRIGPVLAQLIASGIEVEVESSTVVAGDGVVLACERWLVRSGVASSRFARTIHPTLVMRQVEGSWKLAIAAPWGWPDRGR